MTRFWVLCLALIPIALVAGDPPASGPADAPATLVAGDAPAATSTDAPAPRVAGDAPAPGPVDSQVRQLVDLVNEHRADIGCPALAWNAQVASVAQAHSKDMVRRKYFSHITPDGADPFDRLDAAGVDYKTAAENIAGGYPSAETTLKGWLGSPSHRVNLEDCQLTQHGVGLDGTLWTHVFITP